MAMLVVIGACHAQRRELRHPVGEKTTTSSAPNYTPPSVELYLARKAVAPCGMDRLPRIEFAFGSSSLDAPQDLELRRLALCLTERPFDATTVVLVGHADPIGSATYNLHLGRQRAENVRTRLVDAGVAADRIAVSSAGEALLPHDRWDGARRVDILIEEAP
jgi:outer membrane protein OmpA-like peptidoglycan-associated protein